MLGCTFPHSGLPQISSSSTSLTSNRVQPDGTCDKTTGAGLGIPVLWPVHYDTGNCRVKCPQFKDSRLIPVLAFDVSDLSFVRPP